MSGRRLFIHRRAIWSLGGIVEIFCGKPTDNESSLPTVSYWLGVHASLADMARYDDLPKIPTEVIRRMKMLWIYGFEIERLGVK